MAQMYSIGETFITHADVDAGREWLADGEWDELVDTFGDKEIINMIHRLYIGGWAQFLADGAQGEANV